ncbi:MAG: hypothetical protein AB1346_07060 [Thermodesulfobacteriota bacterium]
MESRRLLAYIESLPEGERRKYKSLIDDALRRDRELSLAVCEANRQAELYDMESRRLREAAAQFHASVARLNGKLSAIAEMAGTVSRGSGCAAPPPGRTTLH